MSDFPITLFSFAKLMSLQNPAMNVGRSDILWSRLETFPPKDISPFVLICVIRSLRTHNVQMDEDPRGRVVYISKSTPFN